MQFCLAVLVAAAVVGNYATALPFVEDAPTCSIEIPPQPNFNAAAFYTGRWYVSGGTPRPTPGTSCAYYNITAGTEYPLKFQQHIKILGRIVTSDGEVTPDSVNGGATASGRDDTLDIDLGLTVMDTDYSSYAIAVACAKKGIFIVQQALVVSRTPNKPQNFEDLKEKIHNMGFAVNPIAWGEVTNDDCK